MELLARTCKTEQMNLQRLWARLFVIVGGVLWIAMAWGTQWAYRGSPLAQALGYALIVTLAIAAIFVLGLFYESLTAAILAVGALALLVYGAIAGWEAGVWGVVIFFFVLPMLTAAALYYLAARMQRICEMRE